MFKKVAYLKCPMCSMIFDPKHKVMSCKDDDRIVKCPFCDYKGSIDISEVVIRV